MGDQAPSAQSTMTTIEMSRTFSPIILFSIVLPLIDIVTDLRIIIRLFSGIVYCILPDDVEFNDDDDDSRYIYLDYLDFGFDLEYVKVSSEPVCEVEIHRKFATLLLGELKG